MLKHIYSIEELLPNLQFLQSTNSSAFLTRPNSSLNFSIENNTPTKRPNTIVNPRAMMIHLQNARSLVTKTHPFWVYSRIRFGALSPFLVHKLETNNSPLKIGHPKRKVVFQPAIFRGYVCFREGTLLANHLSKLGLFLMWDEKT